jgi:hypothetical protein
VGLLLLKKYGTPSRPLLFTLDQGENGFSRDALVDALTLLCNGAVERLPPSPAPRSAPSAEHGSVITASTRALEPEDRSSGRDRDLPPDLRALYKQLGAWNREMAYLKGQMLRVQDGMELGQLANEIVRIDKQHAAGWRRIEYWRATGQVLGNPDPATPDLKALILERNSLRAQLSKVKHGKTRPDAKRDAERKDRLADLEKLTNGAPKN